MREVSWSIIILHRIQYQLEAFFVSGLIDNLTPISLLNTRKQWRNGSECFAHSDKCIGDSNASLYCHATFQDTRKHYDPMLRKSGHRYRRMLHALEPVAICDQFSHLIFRVPSLSQNRRILSSSSLNAFAPSSWCLTTSKLSQLSLRLKSRRRFIAEISTTGSPFRDRRRRAPI